MRERSEATLQAGSRNTRRERRMKDVFGLEGEPALVVGKGYRSGRETAP
jgi:hypothetical protein